MSPALACVQRVWDGWAHGSILTIGTWRLRKCGRGNLDELPEGTEQSRWETEPSTGPGAPQRAERGEREEPVSVRKGGTGRHWDKQVPTSEEKGH